MTVLFFSAGLLFGILQLFLTKKTVDSLTAKANGKLLIFVLIKLALYAAGISVIFILLNKCILPFGIGFAAGMVAGAFINFIISMNKDKSNNKGDDTP